MRFSTVLAVSLMTLAAVIFPGFRGGEPQEINETVVAEFRVDNVSEYVLEVADEPDEREKGLMHRRSLSRNGGMVFVYEKSEVRSFWMKNTYVPLDIIFLNSSKHVINIERARPEPWTPEHKLEHYTSEQPARYVIEVSAGSADSMGVSKGTEVRWNSNVYQ